LPKPFFVTILDGIMKNKLGLVLLVLVCLGLGIGLLLVKNQAAEQKRADTERLLGVSNDLKQTSFKLEEQKQVSTMLEKDLDAQKHALNDLSNNLNKVSTDLTQTTASLAQSQAALKVSQEEVQKRDAKIAELETQNQALDKQALDLSNAITNLTQQIAVTQKKLDTAEGDKAFLEKELKRLMTEKADLERQFNDLTVLRAQVAKLKEELSIARRIEWIRQGLYARNDQKGAQQLMRTAPTAAAKPARPAYDLNVEVSADGTVKVIPPQTNAPVAR
jgi:uncharacterized protein (DUF3084 family)